MGNNVKQIKYGELEKDFFGQCQELVQDAKKHIKQTPERGKSAGYTFMQAYFGHAKGAREFCQSMETLYMNTRERLKESGALFKDIDQEIARSIEKEG